MAIRQHSWNLVRRRWTARRHTVISYHSARRYDRNRRIIIADRAQRIATWLRILFSKNEACAFLSDVTQAKDREYPAVRNPYMTANYFY